MFDYRLLLAGLSITWLASACDSTSVQRSNMTDDSVKYTTMDWTELMPPSDLEALLNPPDYISDITEGSAADESASMLKSTITDPANNYQQALISTDVRSELDGKHIRLAGYLVPVEFNDEQQATTLFAVPFFGACLHFPPPPPNQIILVQSDQGVPMGDLDTPYWLAGELHTGLTENDMATSAYSMTLQSHELYDEP